MMRMFFDQSNIDPSMGYGDDGNDPRELAEAVVYAYTADELEERIPEWFTHGDNRCYVHDEWWTDVHEQLSDEQMDADWDRMVADGSVYRLTLAYLIARRGLVWMAFLDHYADQEEDSDESFH